MSDKQSFHPTERFSDRVGNYVKFRPTYPGELVEFLVSDLGFKKGSAVVDIGSGTGIFSELLLKAGCHAIGVEPNQEMRNTAEEILSAYPSFKSIDGRSEKTGLEDRTADHIVAAQAYHWFEPAATRREFERILRPGGWVVLIWNDRRTTESPFAVEYEALINSFATDYKRVNHKNIDEEEIRRFLGPDGYGKKSFYNFQELDFAGLVGRLASSSYAPNVGQPNYDEMASDLRIIFDRHQVGGSVRIEYDCRAFYGQLALPR